MITADALRALLHYDQETGEFAWRKTQKGVRWPRPAGRRQSGGYVQICLHQRFYYAHRLAWLYVYNAWPDRQIDHINRDRGDNRIANLRLATASQNAANAVVRRTNQCGRKGVVKDRRRWVARISVEGREIRLGSFATGSDASVAYEKAARHYFGEFARGDREGRSADSERVT